MSELSRPLSADWLAKRARITVHPGEQVDFGAAGFPPPDASVEAPQAAAIPQAAGGGVNPWMAAGAMGLGGLGLYGLYRQNRPRAEEEGAAVAGGGEFGLPEGIEIPELPEKTGEAMPPIPAQPFAPPSGMPKPPTQLPEGWAQHPTDPAAGFLQDHPQRAPQPGMFQGLWDETIAPRIRGLGDAIGGPVGGWIHDNPGWAGGAGAGLGALGLYGLLHGLGGDDEEDEDSGIRRSGRVRLV